MHSAVIAVDAAPFAERVGTWIPDLARAGLRRATLYHAIEAEGPQSAAELDALRPWLDHLAVNLSSQSVEVEVSLKRGDRLRWLLSLTQLRAADLIIVGPRCSRAPGRSAVGALLAPLLEESQVPVLVLAGARRPAEPGLLDRPVVAGPEVADPAHALLPQAAFTSAGPNGDDFSGASLVVTRADANAAALERLLAPGGRPVLVFPAPALGHAPAGPR
jgi:hypothetical protein